MGKSSYARAIYCVTLRENMTDPLLDQIARHFQQPIPSIAPEALMESHPKHRNKILMINYQERQTLLKEIKLLPLAWKKFETILFNVPNRLSTEELLALGDLKAIFYKDESPDGIAYGLNQVVDGINWLPRKVASQLLHYYRSVIHSNSTPVSVDLTIREIQVLRCLQDGASNAEIAEGMFISEYTVKSHLYQIYRKLAVKNRIQAIAWADQNLNA